MTYSPIDAGPLPVATIKAALGLELAPGPVHFSSRAQAHAASGHPADFALCVAHLVEDRTRRTGSS